MSNCCPLDKQMLFIAPNNFVLLVLLQKYATVVVATTYTPSDLGSAVDDVFVCSVRTRYVRHMPGQHQAIVEISVLLTVCVFRQPQGCPVKMLLLGAWCFWVIRDVLEALSETVLLYCQTLPEDERTVYLLKNCPLKVNTLPYHYFNVTPFSLQVDGYSCLWFLVECHYTIIIRIGSVFILTK